MAAPRFTVKVRGIDDVKTLMKDLSTATQRNVVRRAMKAAAEPIIDEAKSLAPKDEGLLAESIVASTKLTKRQRPFGGAGTTKVLTPKGWRTTGGRFVLTEKGWRRAPSDPVLYIGVAGRLRASIAHIIEFGSAYLRAQAFMRPAFDAKVQDALDRFGEVLGVEVQKAKARAARKAARLLAGIKHG